MKSLQLKLPAAQRGAIDQRTVAIAVGAAIVVAFAVWLFYPRPGTESLPETGRDAAEQTPEPAATDEERAVSAREAIAELQQASPPDYVGAVERGRQFEQAGRLADAQLMYFFAARGGEPQAAYELGQMYDPTSFSAEQSIMDEPDPFQAYKWYTQAADGGVSAADERLGELREWTEREAEAGNVDAEQLLVQWN